jgi:hypothetical protein
MVGFLVAHFKGQVVVPDFGFYGREGSVSLIRETRLVAGLNTLRQNVLLIKDKVASGTTVEDTETLVMALRSGPHRDWSPCVFLTLQSLQSLGPCTRPITR